MPKVEIYFYEIGFYFVAWNIGFAFGAARLKQLDCE